MLLGKLLGVLGMWVFHIARLAFYAAVVRCMMWIAWLPLQSQMEGATELYIRYADYTTILVTATLLEVVRRNTLERKKEENPIVTTQPFG